MFRTYSDPHAIYSTDKFVDILDVTTVLLHSHGVITSGVTVLTHAFKAKVWNQLFQVAYLRPFR